jgi:CDP-glucose 4,6-dehydratase
VINSNFWSGKKVLITGHNGFKGTWLTLLLKKLGCEIHGISLDLENNSLAKDIEIEKYCNDHIVDLRDRKKTLEIISKIKPEIIFHLAAQSLVFRSYSDPYLTYTSNLIGLVNILDASRNLDSCKTVINITSDKCYKNLESNEGYVESDILGGHDPYSNSKACSELITESYRESFFKEKNISCITARAGNVIGGGDWCENRLVPDIFRSIISNTSITIRNPDAIRPWQHVLEPLGGYISLAELSYKNNNFSEAWNFGPEKDNFKTVNEVVMQVSKYFNLNGKIQVEKNELHETQILKLNITKSKLRLPWKPQWNFERTIALTCEWYKEYINKNNIEEFTNKQITTYLNEINK